MTSMAHGTVSTGILALVVETAQQRYGLDRGQLLACAGLEEADVADPGQVMSCAALWDLLRAALKRTEDPSFGLRMAECFDLRMQGFWGYGLLSSLTLRQRIGIHLSYQRGRSPAEISFTERGGLAILDVAMQPVEEPLLTLFLDWSYATVCITHRQRLAGRETELELWLGVREQPHHRELRSLAGGSVIFDAPCHRVQFPAWQLDLPLPGDPHLGALARAQLDAQQTRLSSRDGADLIEAVRNRLNIRLEHNPSIERVAEDLRLSARTLRRNLNALGASFQELLEELRRTRALHYLSQTEESVEAIARRLGYAEPANFRRAFRRWLGISPRHFRAVQRSAPQAGVAPRA
jgi:AraC-like DNA-binding protein